MGIAADGRVECSSGTAQFDWNPVVWIQITEPGTYNAQFTLNCSGGDDEGAYWVGASTSLWRHVGGAVKGLFPNGGGENTNPLFIDGLNPFDVPTPTPLPFPVSSRNFVCEPGVPIVAQKSFDLKGPSNPPEPDIIALVILVSTYMISPVDPTVVFDPLAGSYGQSGTISGSVTIARVGP